MTLTLIIATIGRPTLVRTLQSVKDQPMRDGDVVLVVGRGAFIEETARQFGAQFLDCPPGGHLGSEERIAAFPHVTTSHLAFLDDDDIWAAGAREAIASGQQATPSNPMLYRMQYADGRRLWRDKAVRRANVGTPMMVLPNQREKFGQWSGSRFNDFDFLNSMHWTPKEIVWRPEVLALVRPV
jgi:hypothetical protein